MSATDWLADLRQSGLAGFQQAGLPGRRDEAWHYTDLSQSEVAAFPLAEPPAAETAGDGLRLVNGFLAAPLACMPAGITVERLESAPVARQHVGRLLPGGERSLSALNAGRFTDGLLLRVGAGAADTPIELLWQARADRGPLQIHGRLLVLVEAGASATLVERYRGSGRYFANVVVEMVLEKGASLRHVTLQDESAEATHVSAIGVELAAGARYDGVLVQLGGRLARHEVHGLLAGPGASFALAGATLAAAGQHLDNTVRVVHRAPNGQSRQLFKTVLDGSGHGVFQGTVVVERDAQKTDAHQLSRALMLSDQAAMDSKPELEIYADDVKCGHGSAIGDIDETALFYLRARGIDEGTARRLLIEAFLGEVVERIADETLRTAFADLLRRRLPGGAAKEDR